MSVIAYLRVSTDEQNLGLEVQRSAIRKYIGKEKIRAVFVDENVSGGIGISDRPGLLAALTACRRGDRLVVARRDRVARDQFISMGVEKELEKRGCRLESAAGEGNGNDLGSKMQRRMFDLFAEIERDMIRARTKAALAEKRSRGERVSGHLPYGFGLAADGVYLVQDPSEQEVIQQAIRLREDGLSYRAIVQSLADRGMLSRRSQPFGVKQVWAMVNQKP